MTERIVGPDIYIGGKDNQRSEEKPRATKPRQSSAPKQMSGRVFKRKLGRLKKRVTEYRGDSRT